MDDPEVVWALQREMVECEVVLELVLEGDPKAKGRPRLGKGGHTYTPRETVDAQDAVALRVRNALLGREPEPPPTSFGVLAVFFTANRQRRDVDNMLKLVLDAITLSGKRYGMGLWLDDSQVSEVSARLVRNQDSPRTHLRVYRTLTEAAPTVPCEVCGTPVRSYASVTYKTCSRACANQRVLNRRVKGTCRTCGAETLSTPAHPKVYCNQACRAADPAPRFRGPLSPK